MTTLLSKYKTKLLLLAVMCLAFVVQARAQFFEDDGGPGDFEPPPDNDVPLDTYQWVMMGLALAYGAYVFWKNHKMKTAPSPAAAGIIEINKQLFNNQSKTKNHDTVFSFYRSAHSCLPGLPDGAGKGEKKDAPVLWLHHPPEKRKTNPQGCLNRFVLNPPKPRIMRTILNGFHNKTIRYRAVITGGILLTLVPALANDGNAATSSIPVKGGIPLSYYEGFMISVAVAYGIYLIIRARKRKRDSKLSQ